MELRGLDEPEDHSRDALSYMLQARAELERAVGIPANFIQQTPVKFRKNYCERVARARAYYLGIEFAGRVGIKHPDDKYVSITEWDKYE